MFFYLLLGASHASGAWLCAMLPCTEETHAAACCSAEKPARAFCYDP
jgi:hypothetical protein